MAKFTKQTGGGTSFHGTTFEATPKQLIDLFPNSYVNIIKNKDE